MRLRNKRTGEIVDTLCQENAMGIAFGIDHHDGNPTMAYYNSLAELNAEWEDYEEPEGWCITMYGGIGRITKDDEILIPTLNEIGNYFETKEKAEDAVKKLQAWKRLKDKGFKFGRWQFLDDRSGIWVQGKLVPGIVEDLDAIFGGEE